MMPVQPPPPFHPASPQTRTQTKQKKQDRLIYVYPPGPYSTVMCWALGHNTDYNTLNPGANHLSFSRSPSFDAFPRTDRPTDRLANRHSFSPSTRPPAKQL